MTSYDSLDDLLQAADDHNGDENEESDEEPNESMHEQPLTEEALTKKQEYLNIFSCSYSYSKCPRSASQLASFKFLLQIIPSAGKVIGDPDADVDVYLAQVGRFSCLHLPSLSRRSPIQLFLNLFKRLTGCIRCKKEPDEHAGRYTSKENGRHKCNSKIRDDHWNEKAPSPD